MIGLIAIKIPVGDLALENGTTKTIDGVEYGTQRIRITLEFFLGEWFLDSRLGLPYFRDILIKNPNSETVRSVFRRAILNTIGVVSVPILDWTVNATDRTALVNWEAVWSDGQRRAVQAELIL